MTHPTQGFGDADRRPCSPSATARAIRSLSVAFTGAPRSQGSFDRCRDLGRGDGAAGTAVRGAPPDALSHPDSHRRPRLLTGSTARLAAVGSRAPAGHASLPAATAGRDLHPNPEGSALFGFYLTNGSTVIE